MSIATIIIIVLAVLVLWVIFTYNRFVRLSNRAKEAWSDIEVQLKRRYDLIPNLVNTVKGYAAHESQAFEKVSAARSTAMGLPAQAGASLADKAQAENQLTGAIRGIFAIAEAYPELKANENFLELQRELSDTENKIQAARRFYNAVARDFNTGIESFPGNMLTSIGHFTHIEYFELEEEAAKEPVKVNF